MLLLIKPSSEPFIIHGGLFCDGLNDRIVWFSCSSKIFVAIGKLPLFHKNKNKAQKPFMLIEYKFSFLVAMEWTANLRNKSEGDVMNLFRNLSLILDQLKKLHEKDDTGKEVNNINLLLFLI